VHGSVTLFLEFMCRTTNDDFSGQPTEEVLAFFGFRVPETKATLPNIEVIVDQLKILLFLLQGLPPLGAL